VAFYALTFLLSWICWIGAAPLLARGWSVAARPIMLLGTFAWRTRGTGGVGALLGRIGRGRVAAGWYVFAAGFMVAIKLTTALVHRVALGAWPRFGTEAWYVLVLATAVSMWFQAGEEVGWRGYALPRLATRTGLGPATLVLGVIWALWHLPLFFISASDTYRQSFVIFFLEVTALSVVIGWLYWRTGGSLLLAMLLHAAVDNTKDIVSSVNPHPSAVFTLDATPVAWITVAVLWVVAAFLLHAMRGADPRALVDDPPTRGPS
jgi:membrane protease YdiL (CAAX protease family)